MTPSKHDAKLNPKAKHDAKHNALELANAFGLAEPQARWRICRRQLDNNSNNNINNNINNNSNNNISNNNTNNSNNSK